MIAQPNQFERDSARTVHPANGGAGIGSNGFETKSGFETTTATRVGTSAGTSVDPDASVGTLLRELMHEVPTLVTKEIALAKSEMRENLESTKEGMLAVSAGGVVLLGGYVVLLLAAVYALSNVVAPWAAALIVGAIATVVGFMMVSAGKQKLSAQELKPDQTIRSLHKDADAITGRTS